MIVANLWRGFPFISLILLAGLQLDPRRPLRGGERGRASACWRFRHVTLPGPQAGAPHRGGYLDVINTVKYFDLIWVMTGGGPANRTEVFATLIYRVAFQFFRGGRAAALAVIIVVAVAAFSFLYVRLTVRPAADTATAWTAPAPRARRRLRRAGGAEPVRPLPLLLDAGHLPKDPTAAISVPVQWWPAAPTVQAYVSMWPAGPTAATS